MTPAPTRADLGPASHPAEQPRLYDDAEAPAERPVDPAASGPGHEPARRPAPRLNRPERLQGEMRCESLDQRLEPDHPVRLLWRFVEGLDLSELLVNAKAVQGVAGRNRSDVRVPFALLLWAAIDGQSSAREIERLSQAHRAYEWLRGGVPVNYHMLATFRTAHGELLDRLLSESLASLLHEGLIELRTTAQDGMKVRASAGADSFRRQASLEEHLQKAQERVRALREQTEDANAGPRRRKARERAARDREQRLQAALANHAKIAASREARKKGDGLTARASSTDPEARKMQMPDGGFRPAYNAQFATDTASGIVVGVEVTNQGNDQGLMHPMAEQIQVRLERVPENSLVDGGYATVEDIEKTTQLGTTVYAPPKEVAQQKAKGKNPYEAKKGDTPAVAAWRVRMGTEAAQELYRLRGQTAEWVNACLRNRGLYQVRVRGLRKVKAVLLWMVLGHNLLRAAALRARRAAAAEPARC
jgi:transposase